MDGLDDRLDELLAMKKVAELQKAKADAALGEIRTELYAILRELLPAAGQTGRGVMAAWVKRTGYSKAQLERIRNGKTSGTVKRKRE